jgi:hypothetical protein
LPFNPLRSLSFFALAPALSFAVFLVIGTSRLLRGVNLVWRLPQEVERVERDAQ